MRSNLRKMRENWKKWSCVGVCLMLTASLGGCAPSTPETPTGTTTTAEAVTTTTTMSTTTSTTTTTTTTTTTVTTTKKTTTTTKKPTTTTTKKTTKSTTTKKTTAATSQTKGSATGSTTSSTTKKPVPTTLKPTYAIQSETEEASDLLKSFIKKAVKKYGGAGIQVAVLSGDEVVHTGQYGWAQKDPAVAVTADTMYRIGSNTKIPVSMILHRLIDDGKIALDDDISDYLGVTVRHPDYPDLPITVRMLLCHNSALRDVDYFDNPKQLREHLTSGNAFTDAKPGTTYVYNNFAFFVLGTVCEFAANSNITDMSETYFFKPMGIRGSFMRGRVPAKDFGIGYDVSGYARVSMASKNQGVNSYFKKPGYTMFCFAGNLYISASDYARLLSVLMNDGMYNGKRLLSSEAVASILEVQYQRTDYDYLCQPIWRRDGLYGQDTLYYHSGSAYGMYTLFAFNPDTDTAVMVITSGASGSKNADKVYGVCGDIISAVYEHSDIFFGKTSD